MIFHVYKHPRADTLAWVNQHRDEAEPSLPAGYERMTPEAYRTWEQAERAGGWVPAPEPLTAEVQALQADDAADNTEGQQLVSLWQKFVDGTVTTAEQRRVLKWLFKLELKRRKLI